MAIAVVLALGGVRLVLGITGYAGWGVFKVIAYPNAESKNLNRGY